VGKGWCQDSGHVKDGGCQTLGWKLKAYHAGGVIHHRGAVKILSSCRDSISRSGTSESFQATLLAYVASGSTRTTAFAFYKEKIPPKSFCIEL
jgi:hypothetical protein